MADRQPDQEIKRQGPAVANAFDAAGQPTKAAAGFAASCGVGVDELQQVDGPKGRVLMFVGTKKGEPTAALLPGIVKAALDALPIAKRMRWGAGEQEFVRPVHWVVMLFGTTVVDCEILGVRTGKHSRGHRFHAPQPLPIASPAKYVEALREGVTSWRTSPSAASASAAERLRSREAIGGHAVIEDALLDEVTALVEWPVPLRRPLRRTLSCELPQEVPIATMQDHQRYFPVRDAHGKLLQRVHRRRQHREPRSGQSARRQRARRAAAARGRRVLLGHAIGASGSKPRAPTLKSVTFQAKLGSLYDKTERVEPARGAHRRVDRRAMPTLARRAAELSKCDLLTLMVGEFPELQGLMGKYYAQHDGEHAEVCAALEEQYWPRFAGDRIAGDAHRHRARRSPTSSTRSRASSRSARSRPARAIRSACAARRSACCGRSSSGSSISTCAS